MQNIFIAPYNSPIFPSVICVHRSNNWFSDYQLLMPGLMADWNLFHKLRYWRQHTEITVRAIKFSEVSLKERIKVQENCDLLILSHLHSRAELSYPKMPVFCSLIPSFPFITENFLILLLHQSHKHDACFILALQNWRQEFYMSWAIPNINSVIKVSGVQLRSVKP